MISEKKFLPPKSGIETNLRLIQGNSNQHAIGSRAVDVTGETIDQGTWTDVPDYESAGV